MIDETFRKFCTRMWLDYSDEHSAFGTSTLTKEEYVKQYNKWLLKQYAKHKEEK